MRQKQTYTKEYKRQVIEEVQSGSITLAEALKRYELNSSTYYNWVRQYERGRKVGQQAMEIDLSMSAKGNPYDNAKAESFMKTLRNEDEYLKRVLTSVKL